MRRAGAALLVLVVLAVGGFALLQFANARDDADVAAPTAELGETFEVACPQRLAPPQRDRRALSDEQRNAALALGNVVVQGADLSRLAQLQEDISGRYDAELATAGQMLLLEPARGTNVVALAWGRRLVVASPDDPRLTEFADAHLGASGDCG